MILYLFVVTVYGKINVNILLMDFAKMEQIANINIF